jgi:hypothetical protein
VFITARVNGSQKNFFNFKEFVRLSTESELPTKSIFNIDKYSDIVIPGILLFLLKIKSNKDKPISQLFLLDLSKKNKLGSKVLILSVVRISLHKS